MTKISVLTVFVIVLSLALMNVGVVLADAATPSAEQIQRWQKAAEQGDATAQYNLGIAYTIGAGVKLNHVTAVKWYLKAASQGNAKAQLSLGIAYIKGEGVEKNAVESTKWFRKSADQGNTTAQCSLGVAYVNGDGVGKDMAAAYGWLLLAESGGNKSAAKLLATLEKSLSSAQQQAAKAWATQWKSNASIPH